MNGWQPSIGTSKRRKGQRVDTLHFDGHAFTDLWKTDRKKLKISSSSSANGRRIADFRKSKNAETEMLAQGLTTSYCGWEASTMAVSIKKKNFDLKLNLWEPSTVLKTGKFNHSSCGSLLFLHMPVLEAKRTVLMNGSWLTDRIVRFSPGFRTLLICTFMLSLYAYDMGVFLYCLMQLVLKIVILYTLN